MLLKRIGAYVIDMIIILLVARLIGSVLPNQEKINEISLKSQSVIEEFSNAINSEDEEALMIANEKMSSLNYQLSKESIFNDLVLVGLYFLYFIVFQRYNNGQTLGKKLFKIEIIDEEDVVSFKKLLIRGVLLYAMVFSIIDILLVIIFKESMYISISTWVSLIKYFTLLCCFLPILFGKKGLHDKIAGTTVVLVGSDIKDEGKATSWKNTVDKEKEIKKYRVNHTSGKKGR